MILADKMAGTPEAVDSFLAGIMAPAVEKAKEEIADMQAIMDQDVTAGLLPEGSVIEPWDWAYYTEKVRKAKYALDEDQTKPYFKMENVRQGVFDLTTKLFGLNYEKLEGIPVYHEDVEGFKVTDADGSLIGVILTDYFPRSTKRGGAWMTNFVNQEIAADGTDIRPVIVNVGNFAKPTADKPSLMTLDNVETLFHEYGHALHGLLSQCTYKSVSGTSVARDFVELPSQIMENWAFQKDVLTGYARHYETDEVIPDALVEKILAAETFNQGFMTTELAAASILDLKWHMLESVEGIEPEAFEAQACKDMGLIDEVMYLKAMGLTRDMVSMQGLGYKEMLDYLDGVYDLEEAVRILKRDSRHYAKRQLTWFKREKEAVWIRREDFNNDTFKIVDFLVNDLRK
jgi:peptidyl-dipeptidase Dcp